MYFIAAHLFFFSFLMLLSAICVWIYASAQMKLLKVRVFMFAFCLHIHICGLLSHLLACMCVSLALAREVALLLQSDDKWQRQQQITLQEFSLWRTAVENILKLPADLTHTAASVLFVFSAWLPLTLSFSLSNISTIAPCSPHPISPCSGQR